ncbi:MAG: hypothetical protein ACKVJY_03725, partial [Flavobacteriales bacterium]
MKRICSLFFSSIFFVSLVTFTSSVTAQELERDLIFTPNALPSESHTTSLNLQIRGGSPPMVLPFLDDFAWPSFFEESGVDRPELVRWDSSPVRRTSTFALNPPTIGVVTLDGLDADG